MPLSPSMNVILDSQAAVEVKPGSKVKRPLQHGELALKAVDANRGLCRLWLAWVAFCDAHREAPLTDLGKIEDGILAPISITRLNFCSAA
jgi:hypothetical protein